VVSPSSANGAGTSVTKKNLNHLLYGSKENVGRATVQPYAKTSHIESMGQAERTSILPNAQRNVIQLAQIQTSGNKQVKYVGVSKDEEALA